MINLSVLPGDAGIGGMASSSNLTKQEVELLGQDIRFIKESTQFYKSGVKIYENGLYLAAYLIPLFGLAGAWHYRKQREILLGNAQLARRRKAGKIAARHLSKAKKALKPNLATGFYKAMSLALQGFVSDKLNIQMTDFNSVSVFNNLNKTGVGEDEIKEYQACLDESDFRQFSGSDSSMEEMKSFFDRAKKILTKLEKYI